ncbi:MAG: STAS domain-containing protein [Armatimonadetes bacterium]|nr:STAS domain-containing protein [Armatimonadota bacterium]
MEAQPVEISSGQLAGLPVIRLAGELDLMTAAKARDAILAALDECPRVLVLDVRDLTYIDSAGVGVLLAGWQRARNQGGKIVLLAPQPTVKRILSIAGLDEAFPACADEEALLRDWVVGCVVKDRRS